MPTDTAPAGFSEEVALQSAGSVDRSAPPAGFTEERSASEPPPGFTEDTAISQAVATVPKPTIPTEASPQPLAGPKAPRLVQAESAHEAALGSEQDIRNIGAAVGETVTQGPSRPIRPPALVRSGAEPIAPMTPEENRRAGVLAKGMGSAFNLASPAVLPAVAEAPLGAAAAFGAGYATSKSTRFAAKELGASPEMQDLAEQMGWLVTPAGLVDAKTGVEVSPEAVRAAVTAFGGRAGAGVAVTPETVTVRGKVGPLEGSTTFTRGGKPKGPALEPPTIEGVIANAPRADIADYLQKAGGDPEKAKAMYVADQQAATEASKPAVEKKPAEPAQTVIPPKKAATAVKEPAKPIVLESNQVEEAKAEGTQPKGSGASTPAAKVEPKPQPAATPEVSPSQVETVVPKPKEAVESANATVPVSLEPNGPQGPGVPSAGARDNEQLRGGVPERRPSSGNEPERPQEVRGAGVEPTDTHPANLPKPDLSKGSPVTLPDGRRGKVEYSSPSDKLPIVRVKTDDGETVKLTKQADIDKLRATPADGSSASTAPVKGVVDSALANAKALPDLLESQSFKDKGLGGLDVPTQRIVMEHVVAALHHPEVRDAVVKLIPVNMMDNLVGFDGPPKVSFHDKYVLLNSPSADLKGAVALRSDTATALASGVAKKVAELSTPGGTSDLTRGTGEGRTTVGAVDEHRSTVTKTSTASKTNVERRQNVAERKRVTEMSPEEMKKELLTSHVVDLPNRRAFDEAGKAPAVAMSDADGLKALNDKFGYDAGNELLKAKAEALKEAGLDAYHEKGDEFLYRGASPKELESKLEKAREILRNRVIEVQMKDGSVRRFKGADFSYGSGKDLTEAETGLKSHKSEREARGERARGELRGIAEVAERPSEVSKSPAQEVDEQTLHQSEIKRLQGQLSAISEAITKQGYYSSESPALIKKANEVRKDLGEHEDALARLRGEPTRAEKREAAKAAAEKKFDDRPDKAMKYGELGQSQHWQVKEPDYIDKRFQQEIDRYKRAIPEQEAKIKELGPKVGKQKRDLEESTLHFWKKILADTEARDPRKAQKYKEEYRKLVKEAVSHGSPVPQSVIDQLPEFKLAQDARERYEKGRHTSFANRSAAINDTMQKKEGFKVKRQDGKPITEEQIKEISTGVDEMAKVLGPELRDMMRGTDLTISHTSGKHPFLSDAGGQYHPLDRTISAGINNFLGKPIKALAHELGHWLDYESGRVLNSKALIRPKSGGPSTETHYVSEADRSTKPLYELARRTMADSYKVQKLIKVSKLSDLPEAERETIEEMKVVLGPYWHEPRELWARMFEQYIGTKFGSAGVSMRSPEQYQNTPAYWPKEAWGKIEPLFEESLKTRMDAMRERYAPSTIEGESAAKPNLPLGSQVAPAAIVKAEVDAMVGKESESKPVVAEEAKPATKKSDWKIGDIVTFTKTAPGSYLKPNESYVVDSVGKDSVYFRNPRTGAGTSDNLKMLTFAEYTKEAPPRREVISTAKKETAVGARISGRDGSDTKLLTSDGEQPAKYRVVEAADLVPSHNAQTFARNAQYPSGVQERAYDTSKEAQNRVIQQAQKYDPNYTINTNPDAVNGPPIITPDGIVLGGNSRAMSTQRLYKSGNGNQYKGALIAQAQTFGLDKDLIRMMKEPVLVREVAAPKTQDEMRALGTALNKSMTGALGVSERAVSAGKAISRDTLANISGMLDGLGKDASLRDLMRERGKDVLAALVKDGAITERERPQFVDTATGGLSEEGKTFVERALLGSVVDDPRLMDSTPKSILNKLDGSLAALSSVAPRTDAYNILPLVREALREHGEIAQRGTNVEDYLNQTGLFSSQRDPAVDALTRVLAGKSLAVREQFRRFAEDANFDVQGQGTLGLIEQPSPAKAFNEAFGSDLSDEDLENSILKAVQSEPTIQGNVREAPTLGAPQESAGAIQQPTAGEARASGEGTAETTSPREETKLADLFRSESGSFTPAALNPLHIKQSYDDLVKSFIDKKLKLGDKYWKVKDYDQTIADTLHLVDNAPRYFREKAQANLKKALSGLNDDQVRLAHLMSDSDDRDNLEVNHPQEFQQAQNDPEVMKAVKAYAPLADELAQDRIALGWPVRKSLHVEEDPNSANPFVVMDRAGNPVADFKTEGQAIKFVDQNATIEPHVKRTYPEHSKNPLPGDTGAGPFTGSFYADKGLRPPKMDKKSREMSAEYHYEHGRKDFSGYLDSYAQTKEAVLKQNLFDDLAKEATLWKAGTAQPPTITYNGKEYTRPDIALKARKGGATLEPYAIYDPSRGEKFLIKTPDYSTLTTGKPGIGPNDRYLAPKVVVDALENYDASRGGNGPSTLRRFFQEQIVGLFGPAVHVNNIIRHLGHATGTGAFDPRSWPSIARVIMSPKLRERMAQGVDDATIDLLVKRGAYTDWSDIGNLNRYIGGNLNPLTWIRAFGKGVLFDPKFAGGWGGLDPKARVVIADYLKDHVPGMSDQDIADTVNDALGNYNRANWTERQKQLARFTLFPGWDTASAKWFLRHPFKVGIAGALVVLAVNLALRKLGLTKGDDAYDFSYIHVGDRKYRSGLISDSMGEHFTAPLLSGAEAAMKGDDVAAGVTQGVMKGTSSLVGQFSGPTVEMIADQIYNRKYAGGASEIVNPQDRYTPGTWAPNKELEKRIAFAALKGLPAINRFLAPKGDLDWKQGMGSVVGVSNYKYGAEERLKSNAARSMTVSQTLSRLAETEPEAAQKFVEDPNKAAWLTFNSYLSQLEKDLKEIDTQRERVRLADMPATEKREALDSLGSSREQLLSAADSINDQISDMKMRKP